MFCILVMMLKSKVSCQINHLLLTFVIVIILVKNYACPLDQKINIVLGAINAGWNAILLERSMYLYINTQYLLNLLTL